MTAATLIQIPAWGNANLVELIWLGSGLVTILYTASHLGELARDLKAARTSRRVGLSQVAWGYLRREIIRVVQGVCISVIGVYAVSQPPAIPKLGDFVTPAGLILTGVLFAQGLLVSGQSFLDWRTRRSIQESLYHAELAAAKNDETK